MQRPFNIIRFVPRKAFRSWWGMEHLVAVDAVCGDGFVRRARICGEATTVWTLPARITIKGKTVTGHLTCDEEATGNEERPFVEVWRFHCLGKNADIVPRHTI
jgi:hypothetical protein